MTEIKKVLVTGATRGIGRAIAEQLLKHEVKVVGVGRDHSDGLKHPAYTGTNLDLSNLDALDKGIGNLLKEHSDIDALVSNAGRGFFGGLEQFSARQIRESIDLNLLSHMLVARTVLPHFKRLGRGDMILMGSEASLRGGQQGSLYCAAKFGLRGFAQSLREECASGDIRVGIIHPGMVRSEFFEGLRFEPGPASENAILPEDVAEAVWMMLSMRRGTVLDELSLSPQKKVIHFKKS